MLQVIKSFTIDKISVKVECSATSMVLTLHYKGFLGRMFAVGYADECGINGNNQDVTTLVLPITTDPRAPNRCGIFVAHSVGNGNRWVLFSYRIIHTSNSIPNFEHYIS